MQSCNHYIPNADLVFEVLIVRVSVVLETSPYAFNYFSNSHMPSESSMSSIGPMFPRTCVSAVLMSQNDIVEITRTLRKVRLKGIICSNSIIK